MMKKLVIILVLLLAVGSLLVIAQDADDNAECSFWCKVKQVLFGREEAAAGKAATFEELPTVPRAVMRENMAERGQNLLFACDGQRCCNSDADGCFAYSSRDTVTWDYIEDNFERIDVVTLPIREGDERYAAQIPRGSRILLPRLANEVTVSDTILNRDGSINIIGCDSGACQSYVVFSDELVQITGTADEVPTAPPPEQLRRLNTIAGYVPPEGFEFSYGELETGVSGAPTEAEIGTRTAGGIPEGDGAESVRESGGDLEERLPLHAGGGFIEDVPGGYGTGLGEYDERESTAPSYWLTINGQPLQLTPGTEIVASDDESVWNPFNLGRRNEVRFRVTENGELEASYDGEEWELSNYGDLRTVLGGTIQGGIVRSVTMEQFDAQGRVAQSERYSRDAVALGSPPRREAPPQIQPQQQERIAQGRPSSPFEESVAKDPDVRGVGLVITSEDTAFFEYDYRDNPQLRASQAVAAVVPGAASNPYQYLVRIGNQPVVMANDGEYYPVGSLDSSGRPNPGAQRMLMTANIGISVQKLEGFHIDPRGSTLIAEATGEETSLDQYLAQRDVGEDRLRVAYSGQQRTEPSSSSQDTIIVNQEERVFDTTQSFEVDYIDYAFEVREIGGTINGETYTHQYYDPFLDIYFYYNDGDLVGSVQESKFTPASEATSHIQAVSNAIITRRVMAPADAPSPAAAPAPAAGTSASPGPSSTDQIRQAYGNLLPPDQLSSGTDIKLTDGRTIQYNEQEGAIVVRETIPGTGELRETRQRLLYRNEDLGYGWEVKEGKYTRDDVSLRFEGDSMIRTEGDEQTTTRYLQARRAEQSIEVREVETKEDGELVSREYLNPQGDRIAFTDIENGKETRIRIYDTRGRLERICPAGDNSCVTNPNNNENIYVGNDWACQGSAKYCSDENNRVPEDEVCGTNGNPSLCEAISAKEGDSFRNFEGGFWDLARSDTGWQRSFARFTNIINARPGWEGLSHWLTPDAQNRLQRWGRENFDFAFRFDMDLVVPQWLCDYDAVHRVERDGESTIMLEVAPGVLQTSSSISPERSPQPGPILCSEELPCRTDEECSEDGFCEKDGERLEDGYFYRISWAVTAPTDESFTPYLDENGVAVKFNVQIFPEGSSQGTWLYRVGGAASENTLQLANGQSDRDTIVGYSPRRYNKVCIKFGAPPRDLSSDPIYEHCSDPIPESALGQVQWERGGRPGSSGGGNAIVRSSDAQRVQI